MRNVVGGAPIEAATGASRMVAAAIISKGEKVRDTLPTNRPATGLSFIKAWSWPVLAATCMSACATPEFLGAAPLASNRLAIHTEPGVNYGRPIQVDLVFVTDKKALRVVERLNARAYFAHREELSRDFPGGLHIRSFELMPMQSPIIQDTEPPRNLARAFLFANYANDLENRIALNRSSSGTLTLGPAAFTWRAE